MKYIYKIPSSSNHLKYIIRLIILRNSLFWAIFKSCASSNSENSCYIVLFEDILRIGRIDISKKKCTLSIWGIEYLIQRIQSKILYKLSIKPK